MSYTQTFYHIVLRTHCSIPAIVEDHERELYSYMLGFINNKGARLYRIGGMPDHVHLLYPCLQLWQCRSSSKN